MSMILFTICMSERIDLGSHLGPGGGMQSHCLAFFVLGGPGGQNGSKTFPEPTKHRSGAQRGPSVPK